MIVTAGQKGGRATAGWIKLARVRVQDSTVCTETAVVGIVV